MKHVGLALADSETKIAFRYGTLTNDSALIGKLTDIFTKEGVKKVVVGFPVWLKVNGYHQSYYEFKKELELADAGVEIIFINEMFTTKMAKANILESGGKKVTDHEEAARIILSSWLERDTIERN